MALGPRFIGSDVCGDAPRGLSEQRQIRNPGPRHPGAIAEGDSSVVLSGAARDLNPHFPVAVPAAGLGVHGVFATTRGPKPLLLPLAPSHQVFLLAAGVALLSPSQLSCLLGAPEHSIFSRNRRGIGRLL